MSAINPRRAQSAHGSAEQRRCILGCSPQRCDGRQVGRSEARNLRIHVVLDLPRRRIDHQTQSIAEWWARFACGLLEGLFGKFIPPAEALAQSVTKEKSHLHV